MALSTEEEKYLEAAIVRAVEKAKELAKASGYSLDYNVARSKIEAYLRRVANDAKARALSVKVQLEQGISHAANLGFAQGKTAATTPTTQSTPATRVTPSYAAAEDKDSPWGLIILGGLIVLLLVYESGTNVGRWKIF